MRLRSRARFRRSVQNLAALVCVIAAAACESTTDPARGPMAGVWDGVSTCATGSSGCRRFYTLTLADEHGSVSGEAVSGATRPPTSSSYRVHGARSAEGAVTLTLDPEAGGMLPLTIAGTLSSDGRDFVGVLPIPEFGTSDAFQATRRDAQP